jgi:hydroxymethylbilane synthase
MPDLVVEEKIIVTEGDRLSTGPLWNAGGKGLWVKEIEAALLARQIDIAVHSMKDVPGELAAGLALVAIPPRADVRDAVVSRSGQGLDGLPKAARIGTTSLRRACQLKAIRPDFEIEILRGNLDTRLRKVADGMVDAAILACAGLDRLEFAARITERFPIERMLPAVGQGALAVEARSDDERVRGLVQVLNDAGTALAVTAERPFSRAWARPAGLRWLATPNLSTGNWPCWDWLEDRMVPSSSLTRSAESPARPPSLASSWPTLCWPAGPGRSSPSACDCVFTRVGGGWLRQRPVGL